MPKRGPKTEAEIFDCRVRGDYFSTAELAAIARELRFGFAEGVNTTRAADELSQIARAFIRARAVADGIDSNSRRSWASDVRAHAETLQSLIYSAGKRDPATLKRAADRLTHMAGTEVSPDILRDALCGLDFVLHLADAAETNAANVTEGSGTELAAGLSFFFKHTFDISKLTARKRERKLQTFAELFCRSISHKLVCGDLRTALLLNRWVLPAAWTDEPSELQAALYLS